MQKKCFIFFDKMRIGFHFFRSNKNIVSNFFDKMQKQSGIFTCVQIFEYLSNMGAKINQVS